MSCQFGVLPWRYSMCYELETNIWVCWSYNVLVSLGWYNRILQLGNFLRNRNLFLTVVEAVKAKIKVLAGSVSGQGFRCFTDVAFLLHPPGGGQRGKANSFVRALIQSHSGGLCLRGLMTSQRPHLITTPLRVIFQLMNIGETQHWDCSNLLWAKKKWVELL